MSLNLHWEEIRGIYRTTLDELEKKGILLESPQEIYDRIIDRWQFPMYDLDLSKVEVKNETLRKLQQDWNPY